MRVNPPPQNPASLSRQIRERVSCFMIYEAGPAEFRNARWLRSSMTYEPGGQCCCLLKDSRGRSPSSPVEGGGGIGSAAGDIFCIEGAKVALVDRDADVLESAVVEIRRKLAGAHVEGFVADLGEESAAGIVVDKVIAAFGKLDVLVNNVGIRRYEPLAEVPWNTWDAIVRINLLSLVSIVRAALPALRQSGRERHQRIFDVRCLRSQRHGRLRRNEGSRRTWLG
jgi:hypothetical protein